MYEEVWYEYEPNKSLHAKYTDILLSVSGRK